MLIVLVYKFIMYYGLLPSDLPIAVCYKHDAKYHHLSMMGIFCGNFEQNIR